MQCKLSLDVPTEVHILTLSCFSSSFLPSFLDTCRGVAVGRGPNELPTTVSLSLTRQMLSTSEDT